VRRHKVDPSPPRISHDRVVELLVDYHLGRLDPALNRAIEVHVAHCPLCQIQGLSHTGTEKRVIQRRIRKAKPTRRRLISKRGVVIVVVLLIVLILIQVAVFEISTHSGLLSRVISHSSPLLHVMPIVN
jgi:hypothetical protein